MCFDYECLMSLLLELGISTETREHEPIVTVEDGRHLRDEACEGHTKNLFLRDKRKQYWLIVAPVDSSINLKATAHVLGTQRLSFATGADLDQLLRIKPGAVSPLAVINDREGLVSVVIDKTLMQGSVLRFHPLRNDRTTAISTRDFLTFLDAANHPPLIVEVPS